MSSQVLFVLGHDDAVDPVTLQDFTEWLHAEHPEVANIPTGKPGAAEEANDPKNVELVSAERAEKVLGVKFRGLQETAADSKFHSVRKGR